VVVSELLEVQRLVEQVNNMANSPLDFGSYYDTQGANNILDTLMKFKANSWKDAVGQGYEGINKAVAAGQQREKQQQQNQALMSILQQLQPQQGPPTPPQQGPQLPGQSFPPPQSGMGAQQPSIDPKQLIAGLGPQGVQQLVQQRMTPPPQMNPLQMSEIAKNQALAQRYSQPPQAKLTNPIDDELKRARIQALQKLMARQSQPKPPSPVPAAALDVAVQKANAGLQSRWPWQKAPLITNPLKGKTVPQTSPEAQGLTDEELMAIASGNDDNQ
jgi:hypothetical protein